MVVWGVAGCRTEAVKVADPVELPGAFSASGQAALEQALSEAVELYATEFGEKAGIKIDVHADAIRFSDRAVGEHLFRILQEALSNAVKHSGTANLTVRLIKKGKKAMLEIQDHGKGFDVSGMRLKGKGMGLSTMAERAETVGGKFRMESRHGHGTTICVTVDIQ